MATPVRVLWIEDANEWYFPQSNYLLKLALDIGAEVTIVRYLGGENIRELIDGEVFDIAMVDHKLRDKPNGSETTGETIIKSFIEGQIVHRIIYYSEHAPDLKREEFKDSKNVTCVPRLIARDICLRTIEDIVPPDTEDE